jgi:hypothetical protein
MLSQDRQHDLMIQAVKTVSNIALYEPLCTYPLVVHLRQGSVTSPVLATSDIRSENRHLENGISFLYRLQTKKGKGKIGSRQ